jgi:hypothetical protein
MKPEWISLIPGKEIPGGRSISDTLAMNVPGGCLIMVYYGAPIAYIPGVQIMPEDPGQGGGFRFVSTATEDMEKVLEPMRQLIELFRGATGFVPPKPD